MSKLSIIFEGLNKAYADETMYELAAIWLEKSVTLPDGINGIRIKPGDIVFIKNGKIADSLAGEATHKVISAHGTINNQRLEMQIQDLKTNEISTLKIK